MTVADNPRIERSIACTNPDNKRGSSFRNKRRIPPVLVPDRCSSSASHFYSRLFSLLSSYLSPRFVWISSDYLGCLHDLGHLPLAIDRRLDAESGTRHPGSWLGNSTPLFAERCELEESAISH